MSAAAFQSRQVRRWQSGGLGTRVSLSRCARKRADTSSDTAVGGMLSRSQKLINRLRPLLNRLVGSASATPPTGDRTALAVVAGRGQVLHGNWNRDCSRFSD